MVVIISWRVVLSAGYRRDSERVDGTNNCHYTHSIQFYVSILCIDSARTSSREYFIHSTQSNVLTVGDGI